jgi:Mrp family chromosome partitioning ATPase
MADWLRPVEQIALSTILNGTRVLGLTSPEGGAGVSTLAEAIAQMLSRSGFKVLLLDMTQPVQEPRPLPAGETPDAPDQGEQTVRILGDPGGFDVLAASSTARTRFLFNNVSWIEEMLAHEAADYSKIVMDLPPLFSNRHDLINPVAAAAACDSVLLVCARGQVTIDQVNRAMELVRSSGIRLSGTVLNELAYTPPGAEVARVVRRLFWCVPPLAGFLERKALRSKMLE